MNIPRTPFSTRLSGSAKETELRLRNIFQWKKKRPPVVLFMLTAIMVLLCFGLVSCETAEPPQEEETPATETTPTKESEPPEQQEQGTAQIAPISGAALSPDGSYEVRLAGSVEGVSTDGLAAAEFVQICDTQTGEVFWEGTGAFEHAVVWSPNGKRVALARTTRTGCAVTIIETIKWTAWNVDLPEHTYLPDHWNWIEWTGPTEFHLTMGRGGDAGEEITYYFGPEDFTVAGISEGSEHAGVQVSPTPEPTPEPEPAGPQSSDPGWVLLTFADGTYREGWSSHDDVDTEAAAKGGTRLIFHVKEEELEWASSVEHQKATVRFGGSEWEHPGELFYSSDRKALEFVPTSDDSRAYFYYKQLVSLFYQQSERSVNRQFVLDYVDAMFAEGKTELWAFLFPGTGPIAANLDEYRYEVRSVFMNYEWMLETGSEPQRENSHDDWTMYLENDKAAHIANRTNSNWVRFTIPGQGSVCYSHDGEPGSLSNALLEIFGGPSFRLARVYIPIEGQDDQTLMETYEAKFREQYLASSAITDYRLRELSPITVPDGAGGSPFFLFSFSVKPVNPSWGDWKNYAVGEDGWVDFSFEISLSQGGYENDSAWMCGYWQWHNDKE